MRDLDDLFTGVLLACGARPPLPEMVRRAAWREEVRDMLGETVNQHEEAKTELFISYSRWLETREKHAALQEGDDG